MKKFVWIMVFIIISITTMGETVKEMYDNSYEMTRAENYNSIDRITKETAKQIREIEDKKKNIRKGEFEKTVDFQKRKSEEEKKYNGKIDELKNEEENLINSKMALIYKEEVKCEYEYDADEEKMEVYFEKFKFEIPMKMEEAREKKDILKTEIIYRLNKDNEFKIMGAVVSTDTIIAVIVDKNIKKINNYVFVKGNKTKKDFLMWKYEVTQEEYESVMGYNPSYFKGENLPVERVTWYDAVMYCNKLSEKENLPKYYSIINIKKDGNNIRSASVKIIGGQGYRLPTNEEWEYAAKGGKNSKGYTYSGSNNIDDVAWYDGNTGDTTTHPVRQKKPNELGLYDMSGNVSEWTETTYKGYHRYSRGGYWGSDDNACRLDDLSYDYEFDQGNNLGFRVCRSLN